MGIGPTRRDDREVSAAKQALRTSARQVRSALPSAQRARASARIAVHLEGLRAATSAHRIGVYAALGDEVDIDAQAAAWLAAGMVVAYPRVDGPHSLRFHRVDAVPRQPRGPFGIREPQPTNSVTDELDLLVVPGLAFDVDGGRLGHGRGYYDRYLGGQQGHVTRPATVGVCFAAQLVPTVPQGPLDVRLDAVVTEDGVYRWAS